MLFSFLYDTQALAYNDINSYELIEAHGMHILARLSYFCLEGTLRSE